MDDLRQISPPPQPRRPAFLDLNHENRDALGEIVRGLQAPQPNIAPKFFYDALGSRLFEAICELPEYYLTRVEASIFAERAAEIANSIGPRVTLIDLGAGNCEKAERLFDRLQPAQYVAIDISTEFLRQSLALLQARHPALDVLGLGMDFSAGLELPAVVRRAQRLFFYPGSSLGNFTPGEASSLLRRIYAACGDDGGLLLGVDLVKDRAALEAAYDDALGVTAAFNRNLLNHVNRIIGADFDFRQWRHVAGFNAAESRIEMHLQARADTQVRWLGGQRIFRAGEQIHTENSYKYRAEEVERELRAIGFADVATMVDREARFALLLARCGAPRAPS